MIEYPLNLKSDSKFSINFESTWLHPCSSLPVAMSLRASHETLPSPSTAKNEVSFLTIRQVLIFFLLGEGKESNVPRYLDNSLVLRSVDSHVDCVDLRVVASDHHHTLTDVHRAVVRPKHQHHPRHQPRSPPHPHPSPRPHPHIHSHLVCGRLGWGIQGDSRPIPGTQTSLWIRCQIQFHLSSHLPTKISTLVYIYPTQLPHNLLPSCFNLLVKIPDICAKVVFIIASSNQESPVHHHATG